MNALNNANIQDAHSNRFASIAFPKVKHSETGESVEYVRDVNKQWYVLRIIHNQVQKIANLLIEDGNYAYVAMIWKVETRNGIKHKQLAPFLNLLFAYLSEEQAESYVKQHAKSKYITYYYNHFEENEEGKNPPVIISEKEIEKVILVTSQHCEHVMSVDLNNIKFESNDIVVVTDGPFKGVEGRVARIARQKRVVITLDGINSGITTAYIPSHFLKKFRSAKCNSSPKEII